MVSSECQANRTRTGSGMPSCGDVGDAGQGVGDQLAVRAAVVRVGAEGQADVFGFVDPQPDPDGEQVPLRDDVLARVLHRADDDDADGAALGEQQRQGGVDPLLAWCGR